MNWFVILLCIYYSIGLFFFMITLYTYEVSDDTKYICEVRIKNIMYFLRTKLERGTPYHTHTQIDTRYLDNIERGTLEIPIR